MARAGSSAAGIARILEAYARRGVFHAFSQSSLGRGRVQFSFRWLLDLPFRLIFDSRLATLTLPGLLPGVSPGSDLDRHLRAFVRQRASPARPAHRRIDPARLRVRYFNRAGIISLGFHLRGKEHQYAASKAIHLVQEIFLDFLTLRHQEYLAKHFELPEE